MKSQYTDPELWQMMGNDDDSAFEEIYNRYSKKMFIYAFNVFKKEEICEDIIQNVFIDFWSKRKEVKIINIKSYLFQSVKFQLFKQMRNEKISQVHLSRLNIVDVSLDFSQQLEMGELEARINEEVNKLPPRCQEIFIMSRFHYKSNNEIALELKISMQAVKNQISKAIKLLKEGLQLQKAILLFLIQYL